MSRLFVLGLSPLPLEDPPAVSALNRRTWQVARALAEDGHEVLLVCMRVPGVYARPESLPRVVEMRLRDRLLYRHVPDTLFYAAREVDRWCEEFRPDAVIGVNPHGAERAAALPTGAPMWADLYGYMLGEVQATSEVHGQDWHVTAWQRERAILERADVISTCSRRQRYAVIGELGAVGRLNRITAGYDFVRCIPSAIEPEPYQHTRTVLRGALVEPDDFVVLFAGGYNTWTDVDTLFAGLERAMRRNRRVKFVSTGGAIKGHDEWTFAHFLERIHGSPFADRFIFVGWVPTNDVPNYYLESDVGVNVDKFNYETLLGARYRLTDMCKAGLPVITSLGTEISHEVSRAGVGLSFPIGDSGGLAEAILRLASERDLRDSMGRLAARYALDHWLYSQVCEPLRAWAREPAHAPDFGQPLAAAAAALTPRTRLAQLAWLIETEGYLRAARRVARALLRRALRLPAPALRLAAKAFIERRPIADATLAGVRSGSVLLLPPPNAGETGRAVARLRAALPQAEIILAAAAGTVEAAQVRGPVRVVEIAGTQPGAGLSLRHARQLRVEAPDAVFAVGLGNRRAELLARLIGGRVFIIGEDGGIYESVIAPLKAPRRCARWVLRGAQWPAYGALMGLVVVGIVVADAIAALIRITRRGDNRRRR